MRILITGRDGQLGRELGRVLPALGDVIALDRAGLDLTDSDAISNRVRLFKPNVIINAAAYTAVDAAERDREGAFAVNARGPAVLAEEARRLGALLVHFSTDYVFDGEKDGPYREDDLPRPINVYGESKLAGEKALEASGCRRLVLRLSWVYGARGRNFLLTMLRLAEERREIRVVDDRVGAPTWCRTIALATRDLVRGDFDDQTPLLHLAAGGDTSWFTFACAIFDSTRPMWKRQLKVIPVPSTAYPSAARRPRNSRLNTDLLEYQLGRGLPHWKEELALCLADLSDS